MWHTPAILRPQCYFTWVWGLVLAWVTGAFSPACPCAHCFPTVSDPELSWYHPSLASQRGTWGHIFRGAFATAPKELPGKSLRPHFSSALCKPRNARYTHRLCLIEFSPFPLVLMQTHYTACSHMSASEQAEINICWIDKSMNEWMKLIEESLM